MLVDNRALAERTGEEVGGEVACCTARLAIQEAPADSDNFSITVGSMSLFVELPLLSGATRHAKGGRNRNRNRLRRPRALPIQQ